MSLQASDFKAPKVVVVTKEMAARTQLETAILLWFNDGDPVSIHTLAAAAQDCYRALGAHSGKGSAFQKWAQGQSKAFRKKLPDAQNFFKHGLKNLKGKIDLATRHAEVLMFDAALCHNLIFDDFPPLMFLYGLRFAVENPTLATFKIDPFIRESLKIYKVGDLSRSQFIEQLFAPIEEAYRQRKSA